MRSQAPCLFRDLTMGVDSDDENLDGGIGRKDFAACIKAADVGHADIQQDQVRLAFSRFLDHVVAVHGLAADFQVRTAGEQAAQAAADPLMVIGDENSEGSHWFTKPGSWTALPVAALAGRVTFRILARPACVRKRGLRLEAPFSLYA